MASDLHMYMQIQNHGHMLIRPRAKQPTFKCCLYASNCDKKPSWYVTVKTTHIFTPCSNRIHLNFLPWEVSAVWKNMQTLPYYQ